MEGNKVVLGTEDVLMMVKRLAAVITESGKTYSGLYAVPMGGFPVAAMLSTLLRLPVTLTTNAQTLIVDDLIDSGKTLSRFPSNDKAVLVCKNGRMSEVAHYGSRIEGWIVFPWETKSGGAEDAVVRVLECIGEDVTREGLLDTPARVVRSWDKLYGGYKQNPDELLQRTFGAESYDEMVILRHVNFFSTCEHHMLPFYGDVSIAYIPKGRVVGISKLARLVEVYARRLQIQERMTDQIARAIERNLQPVGVMVVVNGQHFCMTSRGVEKQNAIMTTSSILGLFKESDAARNEFLHLVTR